jgi:hypothetical protein
MDADKLRSIIEGKNDRREQQALHTASNIIDEIATHQQVIVIANAKIAALRSELKLLTVETLDPAALLGE